MPEFGDYTDKVEECGGNDSHIYRGRPTHHYLVEVISKLLNGLDDVAAGSPHKWLSERIRGSCPAG